MPAAAIRNPGFESSSVVDGWDVVTYGAAANVAAGSDGRPGGSAVAAHHGRRSRRTRRCGQEVALRPGGWYRFSGWVSTSGLDPRDAPVCGTYQIQRAGGPRAPSRRAASHPGRHRLDRGRPGVPGARRRSRPHRPVPGRFRQGDRHGLVRRHGARSVRAVAGARDHHPRVPPAGSDRARPVRPVHRVSLRPRARDVGRQALRRRLRGPQPVHAAALPQGDRLPRAPLVSAGRDQSRPVRARHRRPRSAAPVSYRIIAEEDVPCTLGIAQDGHRGAARGRLYVLVLPQAEGDSAESGAGPPASRGDRVRDRASSEPHGGVGRSTRPGSSRRPPTTAATISIEFRGPGTLWLDSARPDARGRDRRLAQATSSRRSAR